MKTKYSFEIMNLDDGLVAVPVGENASQFHGVLKVNETAVAILKQLEKDTTEEDIVKSLLEEYAGEKEEIAGYVRAFVGKLINEGIVE